MIFTYYCMLEVYVRLLCVCGGPDPEPVAPVGEQQGRHHRQQAAQHVEYTSLQQRED